MLKTGIALFKMPLAHSPGRFVNFSLRLQFRWERWKGYLPSQYEESEPLNEP